MLSELRRNQYVTSNSRQHSKHNKSIHLNHSSSLCTIASLLLLIQSSNNEIECYEFKYLVKKLMSIHSPIVTLFNISNYKQQQQQQQQLNRQYQPDCVPRVKNDCLYTTTNLKSKRIKHLLGHIFDATSNKSLVSANRRSLDQDYDDEDDDDDDDELSEDNNVSNTDNDLNFDIISEDQNFFSDPDDYKHANNNTNNYNNISQHESKTNKLLQNESNNKVRKKNKKKRKKKKKRNKKQQLTVNNNDDHNSQQTHSEQLRGSDSEIQNAPKRKRKSNTNKKSIISNENRKKTRKKKKRKEELDENFAKQYQQQSVETENLQSIQLNNQCVYQINSGLACITISDVERAIARARIVMGVSETPPSDVDSTEPSEATLNLIGELVEITTRELARRFSLDLQDISQGLLSINMATTSLWPSCPRLFRGVQCVALSRYRSHTGLCNNLYQPLMGASNTAFSRSLLADYADGVGSPRGSIPSLALDGAQPFSNARRASRLQTLPDVRLLSRLVHPDAYNPDTSSATMFVAFGQLLNHDLALAAPATEQTGHDFTCCSGGDGSNSKRRRSCIPISLDRRDPLYGPANVRCLDLKRALAGVRAGCSLGFREQVNAVTAFIDANFVYGSLESQPTNLRSTSENANERGRLRVWNYFRSARKPLLPPQINDPDVECVGRQGNRYCFDSGDRRVNQQIHLTMLHTIFVRQHNRLASGLTQLNPHWSAARVYHEARHILIAQVQHIFLSEYVPHLLGSSLTAKLNLTEAPQNSYFDLYDSSIDSGISASFAAAAFRSGHSMIASQVYRVNEANQVTRVYRLRDLYRQPWPLFEPDALDEFLRGALASAAQLADPFLSVDVAGHLLQMPDEQVGLDLVAINIARGRDMGLPSYLQFRDWCNLDRLETFEDLTQVMTTRSAELLANMYSSVDDIDLFVGGMSEFRLSGGSQLGPTFSCIVGRQFQRTRLGDRFWFETSIGLQAFTITQLNSIRASPLSRIICSNSDTVSLIQLEALKLPHPIFNKRVHCDSIPELDLTLWKE